MSRHFAITAYRIATTPLRSWIRLRGRQKSEMPVTGIFLHRVADDQPNPWSMTIQQFDSMLAWLEANVDLVSTDEAQRRIREGNNSRPAVVITFDDGYADNCLHAIPTLISKKIPFTYYVTTNNVRTGEYYPHDIKNNQQLAPNSIDEIKAMSDAGVTIGVHTRTHCNVAQLNSKNEFDYEIKGSRNDLAEWTGKLPQHFAFPFGLPEHLSPSSIQYLADEGFSSYCSASGGFNSPYQDSFHLRRFHADPVLPRLKNWLSLDPRWVWATPEWEYTPFDRSREQFVELSV